jgi:hypothetical protein
VLILVAAIALVTPALATRPVPLTDPLPGASTSDPAAVGMWETPFDGHVPAVNMVLLHDGRVLYWSGVEAGENDNVFFTGSPNAGEWRIWDPATSTVEDPASDPYGAAGDLFCSGATILPDGTVITAGGSGWDSLNDSVLNAIYAAANGDPTHADPWPILWGLNDTRLFDPSTDTWTRVSNMSVGRWYPTLFTGSDGKAVVASGIGQLTNPLDMRTTLERWNGGAWANVSGADDLLPLYPRIFTVPDGAMKGDLFYETVGTLWGPFGERPDEAVWSFEQVYDGSGWHMLGPSAFGARQHADSVMLPLDPSDGYTARIVTFGGTLQRSVLATAASEETTIHTDGSVTHRVTGFLNDPRWHANGVGLPDGTILAVGGGMYDNVVAHGQPNVAVLTAERFDPATLTWHDVAAMSVPRMYHSTAVLLPDGRVLAGGHVPLPVPWTAVRDHVPYEDQVAEKRLEIYDPPYLFWGPRPVIASAPSAVRYGQAFDVTTSGPDVTGAVLVHPGATTHAWDSDQRTVKLAMTKGDDGTLHLVAPPDGDVAAPGDWMLFVLHHVDGKGDVPSVASWVHLS